MHLEKQILVPNYGEKIKFGDFFITLLLSEHLPLSPFITMLTGHEKHINEPLSTPAKIYDYKEGDSFAILIEHPNGNILINGSAGYKKGLLNDVKADVVFLGIAGISYQNDKYKDEYYFEVIERVSPSLIIPIHWDDFTVDYSKGLHPPNKLIDDFSSNLDYLISKTSKDSSKEIILLPMWGKIGLF